MTYVAIKSIQQYTIDMIRVNLGAAFEINRVRDIDFKLFDSNNTDVSNKLKSIKVSNNWTDSVLTEQGIMFGKQEVEQFDLYVNTNSFIDEGTYTIKFYETDAYTSEVVEIFSEQLSVKYMEDVRVTLDKVTPIAIDKVKLSFKPLNEENPVYQTKRMLEIMNISFNDTNGTNYNDVFEPLSSILDNYGDNITELVLPLKSGRVLPEGDYSVVLTARYKSRTFSVIENAFNIPFLTTTPPHIGSVNVTKSDSGTTSLNIVFDTFLEQTMFDASKFSIVDADGTDVTSKFDSKNISPRYNSTSGVTYLTQINIPLRVDLYTLEKDVYTITFEWKDIDIYDTITSVYDGKKWFLYEMTSVSLHELDYLTLSLPTTNPYYTDNFSKMGYIIEKYNSAFDEYTADETLQEAFGPLYIPEVNKEDTTIKALCVDIVDKNKLKQDVVYSFIIYHTDDKGERIYDYIGHIDIIAEVTPVIKSVEQKNIDTLTVTLENRLPIEVIKYCVPKLLEYGSSEYIDNLLSIEESNNWDDDVEVTNTFDVMLDDTVILRSSQYTFNLLFGNKLLEKPISIFLQYMESRKGLIKSIEQTSISNIRITFSEPQSRSFLLATDLVVVKISDDENTNDVDYSDRFEHLGNVLEANQFSFTEINVPMNHEKSIPSGKYTISFAYMTSDNTVKVTVYSYDTNLGFMSNNLPVISTIRKSIDTNGITSIKVYFARYIEKELLTKAIITLKDEFGRDNLWKFEHREDWDAPYDKEDPFNFIKSITLEMTSADIKMEKGTYTFNMSWDGVIPYMEDISGTVVMDYILPSTVSAKVAAYNSAEGRARLYFKFENALQISFFETAKIKAYNSDSIDHTEYFATIPESNEFNTTITSTNDINLDVIEPLSISQGTYTFIFYHDKSVLVSANITLPESTPSGTVSNYTLEVINENGYDVSSMFKPLVTGISNELSDINEFTLYSKDDANIYVTDSSSYTIHLYNEVGEEVAITSSLNIVDIKESDYVSKLDIRAALSPRITSIEQMGIDRLLVSLAAEIPVVILDEYNFSLFGFNHADYTSYFDTITDSNNWDDSNILAGGEETLTVSSFELRLRGGCVLQPAGYSFTIYAGTEEEVATGTALELDERSFSVDYMEGASCGIKEISIAEINALQITFEDSQSIDLLNALRLTITEYVTGEDYTTKFENLSEALERAKNEATIANGDMNYILESVTSLQLRVKSGAIPKGSYTIKIVKTDSIQGEIEYGSKNVTLTYMCEESMTPLLYGISATQITEEEHGLMVWFSPPLEVDLFENSVFEIKNTSGMVITDRFVDKSEAILDINDNNSDGIEYVEFATFPLKEGKTLNKDNYTVSFEWVTEDYKYVDKLELTKCIDYILIPLKSVTRKDLSTIELEFPNDIQSSFLLNSELAVDSTYVSKNDDGVVVTYVPFTDKFKVLTDTNDFSTKSTFRKIDVQLKDTEQLPVATYRFIIAEVETEENSKRLRYAYAGSIDIQILTGNDVFKFIQCTITQHSLDTLKLSFVDPINVEIFNNLTMKLTGVSSAIEKQNYSGYFMNIKDSNKYTLEKEEIENISNLIEDKKLREQYDLSYAGLLTFSDVYVFHKEALIAAGILDDAIIKKILTDFDYIPKEKRDECVKCEMEYMLNDFVVTVTPSDAYMTDGNTSGYMNTNSTHYIDADGNMYYEYATKSDTVVEGIHYISYATDKIYLKLADGKAIPEAVYELALVFEEAEVLKQQINTTFMTTVPPQITSMGITDDQNLKVNFYPYAEETTLMDSNFKMMIYSGLNDKGEPIGTDVTNTFGSGSILNGTLSKSDQRGLVYIPNVLLPISPDAFLPSGKYKLDWNWNERSFLPNLSYIGALNVIAKGIKSATLFDAKTIKVVFDTKILASNMKALELTVENSRGEDCSDLFSDMAESNADMPNDTSTDTYYILVEEDEDVVTDTYTFILTSDMSEEDTDDEIIPSPAYKFQMNIVYMTREFPSIEKIDNLSTQTYKIDTITYDNAGDYYGLYVEPLTKNTREILTKDNYKNYLSTAVKIYDTPSIDSLYMVFTEEVHPCLLNACTATVINSDGLDVSNNFKAVYESNTFTGRQVVDHINIILENAYEDEQLEKFEVDVFKANGEKITDDFENISDSNSFEDGIKIRTFNIVVDDENPIEEYESAGIKVIIKDDKGTQITNFKSSIVFKTLDTVKIAKLSLERGYTLPPDQYTVALSYQNEPGLEGTVTITPFTYSGKLPFLSTNLGDIVSITSEDLSKLNVVFSEDLPISLFMDMKTRIYNEDNEDCSDSFKDLQETNVLDEVSQLSQLGTPMTLTYELKVGKYLNPGRYTVQCTTNISSGEDDDGEEEIDDEQRKSNEDITDEYILWTYGTSLPYMVKSSDNAIKEVAQTAIDEIKITLENPIDLNLLKNFAVTVSNKGNNEYYDIETFKDLNVSNRFGYSVLLSDNRYILYSEDNESWSRFDTGVETAFTDMIYDETSEALIVTCGNGKLLSIPDFANSTIETISTGISKGLNSVIKVGSKLVAVGLDGTVVIGQYSSIGYTWATVNSNTKNTLTQVISVSDTELFAIGYKGTLIHSTDGGSTWEVIPMGNSQNFNGIVNYKYNPVVEVEEEDNSSTDDELSGEEEVGEVEEEDTPDTDEDDNFKNRNGIYIVGSSGLILYSPNGKGSWETIASGVSNSLFGITSHNNKLIAVGDSGTILSSPDTLKFNKISSGVTFTLRKIAVCDQKLVACGANGKWITSSSGNKWTVNSTIYSNTFRNVGYVPSQYEDNRSIDYFYLKLADGAEIGNVTFYSGSVIPTLENTPASSWMSDSAKNNHVGDVYNLYKDVNGIITHERAYQFVLENTYDETGLVIASEYKWKDVGNSVTPSTGKYTFYVVEADTSNTSSSSNIEKINGRRIFYEKSDVELNYLTADPGDVLYATLTNPDIKEDVSYQTPFIHIEMEECNEVAMHFASYEIIDANGNDCSGYFSPIKQGITTYSSSYTVSGIDLLGNPDTIWDIPAGNYTLLWSWSRFDDRKKALPLVIPKIERFIESVTPFVPAINSFQFKIGSTNPPLNYFTDNTSGVYDLQMKMLKIDTTGAGAVKDYSNGFMSAFESTNFDEVGYKTVDNKVAMFNLQLNKGARLNIGKYIMKLNNEKTAISEDTMVVTTTIFDVTFELTDSFPSISDIKVVKYCNAVEGIVNDNEAGTAPLIENYEGLTHPMYSTYYSNWKTMGSATEWDSELKKHVGDIYKDTGTGNTYSFIYDSAAGDYRWELNIETPHLILTFGGNRPPLSVVLAYTNYITFSEHDASGTLTADLTNYLLHDINEWDFELVTDDGETRVTKIKIPLDETVSYPGTTNGKFFYYWKDTCIYDDIIVEGVKTDSAIRDYGEIVSVSPVTIPGLTPQEKNEYGLLVKFEKVQYSDFLINIDWTMTHSAYDSEGVPIEEDVAGYFKSIDVANDYFNGMDRVNSMYLFLQDGQAIDAGEYTLELTGYKPKEDILHDEGDGMVHFTYKVNLPWITSSPPSEFIATLTHKKEGFNYPVLNVEFDVAPPIDGVNQFKINVTKAADLVDYSDCFRGYASSIVKFNYTDECQWDCGCGYKNTSTTNATLNRCANCGAPAIPTVRYIKSIDIPMKRCRGMKIATYDATFTFNDNCIIAPISSNGFTTEKNIITKMGKVVNMTTQGRDKMIVEIQPDAEVDGSNIATSQVGQVYGWTSWNDAINKTLDMSAKNGSGVEKIEMFKGPEISGNKLTFTLKDNKKINPCKLKLGLKFEGYYVISSKKIPFKGLIVNLKASKKDKLCYILVTKHDGVTRKHVYSTYEKAMKRIKKMKKLNKAEEAQIAICKQCRKIKLLSTSKIKAQLEKYDFPVGKRLKFFKKAAKKWYKYQAQAVGCTEVQIEDDINESEDEGRLQCANYVKKATPYDWKLKIATMATGYPNAGKVIIFAFHVKDGVQLERGFKGNKKGKKTKKFKKYMKKLKKFIKNYKKKAAKCKKCKKKTIAKKGSTSIGWKAALLPKYLKDQSSIADALTKILTNFFKKKKNGCAKAKFKFVKKNKNYCRITCKKFKKTDKTLECGSFRAYFKK